MDKTQKYGIFSAAAVETSQDTFRFRTPTGGEVVVTTTSDDPAADFYKWTDKVCLGEIVPAPGGLVRTIKGTPSHGHHSRRWW